MSQFQNNSIFWIETDKIVPNPYQPRREFDQNKLQDLSDSIRQYGVLQPLVVSRIEKEKEDGGIYTQYELIAGERRLRASKMAGVTVVPVIIRSGEEDNRVKLELAIIENLQREDLNPIDRARAFSQLADEFGFKHSEIAKKMGKSREYVSNSIRLLALPEFILQALSEGKITEGHARPLMMLGDRPQEQETLFKEILFKKMTVRGAESIARRVAYDKVRKKEAFIDPEIVEMEERLATTLGTRVHIEKGQTGGKVTIDFFSNDDLRKIIEAMNKEGLEEEKDPNEMLNSFIESRNGEVPEIPKVDGAFSADIFEEKKDYFIEDGNENKLEVSVPDYSDYQDEQKEQENILESQDNRNTTQENEEDLERKKSDDSSIYSVNNFTI